MYIFFLYLLIILVVLEVIVIIKSNELLIFNIRYWDINYFNLYYFILVFFKYVNNFRRFEEFGLYKLKNFDSVNLLLYIFYYFEFFNEVLFYFFIINIRSSYIIN